MNKFPLGSVVITTNAMALIEENYSAPQVQLTTLLKRHAECDWGNVPPEDAEQNNSALIKGQEQRILSSYEVTKDQNIWIITEWDRSVTTILLPDDY
jgi:hypothetical protein